MHSILSLPPSPIPTLLHYSSIFIFIFFLVNPSSLLFIPLVAPLTMLSSLESHDHQHHSSDHSRQLLINCAELIHRSDFPAARQIASLLLSQSTNSYSSSSPSSASSSSHFLGDSTDRLVHQFTLALSLRLSITPAPPPIDPDAVQSSYLSLNQITPFLRFAHLTANQAILEAIEGSHSVHILDFDTSHGFQWPPLLQAIAGRSDAAHPPPSIRITGTGSDLEQLRRTSDRLEAYAMTLGLPFQFHPLLLPSSNNNSGRNSDYAFQLHPGETLAVNCVMFLNKLMTDGGDPFDLDGSREVRAFLQAVRAMNPAVVTVAEREASFNSPLFLQRFMEALDHYTSIFESLEATLPPANQDRLKVEKVWLRREIADVVAGEGQGEGRRERSQRFERWEGLMRSAGFRSRALSSFAVSQAKFLLRLHYPSEGYMLKMVRDCFFLGWQNKPLFSVSSWN